MSGKQTKLLLYTNNTVLLVSADSALSAIRSCLTIYSRASNAKINVEKSTAIVIENVGEESIGFLLLEKGKKLIYLGVLFITEEIAKEEMI